MKGHDYVNLKIGDIAQYSMVIKKDDLSYWKDLGWEEYKEIDLRKGDEDAYLLYGELNKEVETLIFNRPILLKDTLKEKITGKTILEINSRLGTYGMGGPGFFGLLLESNEYVVYSVWNAGNYVFVNDRIVECSLDCYYKAKPWISNFSNLVWDDLTDYIVGSTIIDYTIGDEACKLQLQKGTKNIEIQFVRNDKKIPRKAGRFRTAFKDGKIGDYIVFQHKDGTLIV